MNADEIETLKTEVVALHADTEALLRDAGVAWQEATRKRHQLLHSGEFNAEHFGVGLGDVVIAHQLRGVLVANGFRSLLTTAGSPTGDAPVNDFAAQIARAIEWLAPRQQSEGDGLTVGQQPTPPRNVQSGLLEQA